MGKKNAEIRAITDEEAYKAGMEDLSKAIAKVMEFGEIAWKKGLIELEEETWRLDMGTSERYLKTMTMLVVDGTDSDQIEEISMLRYFAEGLTGFEALRYLIYLVGILTIQRGENPHIIEEKLHAMMPRKENTRVISFTIDIV